MVTVVYSGPVGCGWLWRGMVVLLQCLVHVVILRGYVVVLCSARVESPVWSPMRACKKLRRVWRLVGMVDMVVCPPCGAWWAMRTR